LIIGSSGLKQAELLPAEQPAAQVAPVVVQDDGLLPGMSPQPVPAT